MSGGEDRYLDGLEASAAARLPSAVYRYFAQGARDGITVAEALPAWDALRLVPRVLVDVTAVDTSATMLGTQLRSPFAIAPTTLQRAAHPDGELAMARGAAAAGSLLVVSSNAGTSFAQIGSTGVPWWLQMYVTASRPACVPVVEAAVTAGARAVVLTVDTPVVGTKHTRGADVWKLVQPGWLRANFPDDAVAALAKARDLGPDDIAWLGATSGLPVVVKGVLHPADARRCVEAGAAAVWVSNHGGRQLDAAAATVHCLEGIAREVGEDAEVYVDGGVRRGVHAVAARALGARGVFLGRPSLYALADAGEEGVARLLAELAEELAEALTLAGSPSFEGVLRDLVRP